MQVLLCFKDLDHPQDLASTEQKSAHSYTLHPLSG